MTLTLPIEIGKKYVLRDGVIATGNQTDGAILRLVTDTHPPQIVYVYTATGRVCRDFSQESPSDLVADHVEKKGHMHAALMAEYARDAAETDKPWERWQIQKMNFSGWADLTGSPTWVLGREYRRKPRTITINDREILHEHVLASRAEIENIFKEADAL